MTRVYRAHAQHATNRSTILDQPRAVAKKKKPYKIVLEAVTQEKKKLHSILTYASNAPKGFGFVPAGHPEFTEWCKEQCRQRNLDVHIVSAKPKNKMHADPEKLSHHVHRVGHHFPIEIVNLACSKFGYTYDEVHGLQKDKASNRTNWIARGIEDYSSRQQLHGRPSTEKESKEHTRGAVREMFPKIPEADLNSIVNHAFEEGTNRVGNAKELSLARRVQLAVVAHIRHVYTDYDKMLKTGSWMQARQSVEHVSLAKLKEWRDEAGEASNEIEDTFREVIVLDDDDEDSSGEDSLSTPDEREQSMEIVSSRATARDLQPERYADYPHMDVYATRRVPRRTIVVQPYHSSHSASVSGPPQRQPVSQSHLRHARHPLPVPDRRPPSRDQSSIAAHGRPIEARSRLQCPQPAPRGPSLMQEIDGQLYHVSVRLVEPLVRDIKLEPIRESSPPPRPQHHRPLHAAPHYAHTEYVQVPPAAGNSSRRPAHSRHPSDQDVVLPSVERETVDLTSPRRNTNSHNPHPDARPDSGNYTAIQSPKRKSFPYFPNDRDDHMVPGNKRPRPIYHEEDPGPRAAPAHLSRPPQASSYHHMNSQSRPRMQPPQEYIDLTASPRQPVPVGEHRYHVPSPAHARSDSNGMSYVPIASHRAPMREDRGQYQVHSGEPSRAHMSNSGIYEGRAPPIRDYVPFAEQHQRPVDGAGARYLRSGLHHGGSDLN